MMRSLSNLLSTLEAQLGPVMMVAILFGIATLLGLLFGASLMGIVAAARRRRVSREYEEEQELLQNLLNDTRMRSSRLESENDTLNTKVASFGEREAKYANDDAKNEKENRRLGTELKAAQMLLEVKDEELTSKEDLLQERETARLVAESPAQKEAHALALQHAKEQGLSEGREAGLKDGLQDGLEQGRSEGRKAGLEEGLEQGRKRGHKEGLKIGHEKGVSDAMSQARKEASAVTAPDMAIMAAKAAEPPTLIKRVRSHDEGSLSSAETGIIPDDQIIPTLPEAELTANVEAYDLSDLEDLVNEDV